MPIQRAVNYVNSSKSEDFQYNYSSIKLALCLDELTYGHFIFKSSEFLNCNVASGAEVISPSQPGHCVASVLKVLDRNKNVENYLHKSR